MASNEKNPHDYRLDTSKDGVKLVVRPGNTYGTSRAGEEVTLDLEETYLPSTVAACATRESLERAQAEVDARAASKAAQKKSSSLKTLVEADIARASERAIESARARAEREALDGAAIAARAAAVEAAEIPDVFAAADRAILPGGEKRAAKTPRQPRK